MKSTVTSNPERAIAKVHRCSRCGWKPLELAESIATGLCSACRHEIEFKRRDALKTPSPPDYGRFRISLILRILVEGLTPREVAVILSESGFRQINSSELTELYEMDDVWTPHDMPRGPERDAWRDAVRRSLRNGPSFAQDRETDEKRPDTHVGVAELF